MKILEEKILFENHLIIEEGIVNDGKKEFSRMRLNMQDAAAVLLLNKDTNKFILTKQFRYAITSKSKTQILEIVAGKVDGNEEPMETAVRETEEEVGYAIRTNNIKLLTSCFVSPGYTSERFYIYYAEVTNIDKVSKGGGLESENEKIEIVEMDAPIFYKLLENGEIHDAKTIIAGLFALKFSNEGSVQTQP